MNLIVKSLVFQPIPRSPDLLVPGPFTLYADYKNNKSYPVLNEWTDIMNPMPKYFKGIKPLESPDNPYLPKFIFEGEKDQLLAVDNKFTVACSSNEYDSECSFTGMTNRLLGTSMRINMNSLQLFPKSFKKPQIKTVRPVSSTHVNDSDSEKNGISKKIFSWNWEGLACFGISCTNPFAGDTNASLLLKSHLSQKGNVKFEAKIVAEKDFITDLKSLTGTIGDI